MPKIDLGKRKQVNQQLKLSPSLEIVEPHCEKTVLDRAEDRQESFVEAVEESFTNNGEIAL